MIRRCDTVEDCENGIDEEECGKIDSNITLPKLKRHLFVHQMGENITRNNNFKIYSENCRNRDKIYNLKGIPYTTGR